MLDASVPLPKSDFARRNRCGEITRDLLRDGFRAKRTCVLVVRMTILAYYDYPKQVEGRTVE